MRFVHNDGRIRAWAHAENTINSGLAHHHQQAGASMPGVHLEGRNAASHEVDDRLAAALARPRHVAMKTIAIAATSVATVTDVIVTDVIALAAQKTVTVTVIVT